MNGLAVRGGGAALLTTLLGSEQAGAEPLSLGHDWREVFAISSVGLSRLAQTEVLQGVLELSWKATCNAEGFLDPFVIRRQQTPEEAGVEEEPGANFKIFPKLRAVVFGIANQRVSQRRHVQSDLMLTAVVDLDLYETVAVAVVSVEIPENAEARHCFTTLQRAGAEGLVGGAQRQRAGECASCGHNPAVTKPDVLFHQRFA
mmetsp:Transcript_52230/g.113776  ORF Transcript_52230/g.113776 Transcript_52230/m.113776 type:complete len:202 (+) Transcript_52230:2364-2969(+)